jgi:S1-C subfamily serine protease
MTMRKGPLLILFLFFLNINTVCCHPFPYKYKFPTKSFAKVLKIIEVKKCKKKSKVCFETQFASSGSAIAIAHHNEKTLFLTAAHVCNLPIPKEILQEAEIIKTSTIVQLSNAKYYKVQILSSTDIKKDGIDLCLLSTNKLNIDVVKIAKSIPMVGEPLYALSAPVGIYHPPTVPIFSGIFSGVIPGSRNSLTTIPAIGGSSGSAVLNRRMELVGILFATHPAFTHVSIMTSLDDTRAFVYKTTQPEAPKIKK